MEIDNIPKTALPQQSFLPTFCQKPFDLIHKIKNLVITLFLKIKNYLFPINIPDPIEKKRITTEEFSQKISNQTQKIREISRRIEEKDIQKPEELFEAVKVLQDLSQQRNLVKNDCPEELEELEKAEKSLYSTSAQLFETVFEKALKSENLVEVGKIWLDLENTNCTSQPLTKEIKKVQKHMAKLFLEENTLDTFVKSAPVGILNPGNSCYLNSSCQAIFSSKPLIKRLFSDQIQAENSNMGFLRKALQKLAIQYYITQKERSSSINKEPFTEEIRNILFTAGFFPFEEIDDQQCVGECLLFLLESIQLEKLDVYTTRSAENQSSTSDEKEGLLVIPIEEKESSISVWDFFTNLFSKEKKKPKEGSSLKLESLIESFCNNVQNQPWKNFKCYKEEKRILSAPEVLVIQCKHAGKNGKLSEEIEAPDELDISSIMFEQNIKSKYRLISHIRHHGFSSSGGHYTACVSKDIKEQSTKWYDISDTSVDVSSSEQDSRKNATIYIYERIE